MFIQYGRPTAKEHILIILVLREIVVCIRGEYTDRYAKEKGKWLASFESTSHTLKIASFVAAATQLGRSLKEPSKHRANFIVIDAFSFHDYIQKVKFYYSKILKISSRKIQKFHITYH